MKLKITLFFHCYSSDISMEITGILTLVYFHCCTNENNSDFFLPTCFIVFPLFLLLFFFKYHWNSTGIVKKGNGICIMIFEITVAFLVPVNRLVCTVSDQCY